MRIEKLELLDFKNLREFAITFDPASQTTMLVGHNGTGKSNLIEALVRIFRDLIQHKRGANVLTEFAYRLQYNIRNQEIVIDHEPNRTRERTRIQINGKRARLADLKQGNGPDFLPQTLFAYYSGPSNRLEATFEKPLYEFRDAMIGGVAETRQRLIYGRPIHSKFVLLSFFGEADPTTMKLLDEELGIEALESVLFVIKQPYWSKRRQPAENKSSVWGARGVVKNFLDRLYEESLAPLQLDQRVSIGIRRRQTVQHLYLFLKDQVALKKFVGIVGELGTEGPARELFKVLESAYVSDLIEDVRVNLRKRNFAGHVTFRDLAEGEQQLLMVLGLLRFTRDEESLFLLDEPDTHLNPAWSLRYRDLIGNAIGESETSQLLIATHDPVAVAMLRRNEVRQLVREDDGHIGAYEPNEDPVNLGISGVLMSDLFGFKSTMAPEIADKISRKHRLIAKEDQRSADEEGELSHLRQELREVDLSAIHPDPLYARFVKRILEREAEHVFDKPVLSPKESQELEKLTQEVLDELMADDEAAQ